jgi:hypothetical protein
MAWTRTGVPLLPAASVETTWKPLPNKGGTFRFAAATPMADWRVSAILSCDWALSVAAPSNCYATTNYPRSERRNVLFGLMAPFIAG